MVARGLDLSPTNEHGDGAIHPGGTPRPRPTTQLVEVADHGASAIVLRLVDRFSPEEAAQDSVRGARSKDGPGSAGIVRQVQKEQNQRHRPRALVPKTRCIVAAPLPRLSGETTLAEFAGRRGKSSASPPALLSRRYRGRNLRQVSST